MVNGPHRSPKYPTVTRKFPTAIGLVTLRRDGFVSLDAGADVGMLVTKPFTLQEICEAAEAALTAEPMTCH